MPTFKIGCKQRAFQVKKQMSFCSHIESKSLNIFWNEKKMFRANI